MRILSLILLFCFALLAADEKERIAQIDASLLNNSWANKYANYTLYMDLEKQLNEANEELKKSVNEAQILELKGKISSLQAQADVLGEYAKTPFGELMDAPKIPAIPEVKNPFALFGAFSYLKSLRSLRAGYTLSLEELKRANEALELKVVLIGEISDENMVFELEKAKNELSDFKIALQTAGTAFDIYIKRIDEAIAQINIKITEQIKQALRILGTIAGVFLFGLALKFAIRHYLKNNQKFYTINKFINITGFIIIVFVLLFAYIENVDYLITILGFASAGLAIAMKDMFMSLLGWSVIIAGGSFHVGDRVRVRFQNSDVVGDIIDISLLRITLYEDITLTTYKQNRRSGRIIFIPNNYIFTETIANYTHSGMKTVWDGIDVMITYESNHKKAVYIIKNIVRQYSKGYTEVAKIQMNKLRDQYSIKNTNVEPRIFTFFEPYGINISVWYETNSYATLALRSTISAEIIDAIKNEADIKISYPKETLYLGKDSKARCILGENNESEII